MQRLIRQIAGVSRLLAIVAVALYGCTSEGQTAENELPVRALAAEADVNVDTRAWEPVVLLGEQVQAVLGQDPQTVFAFRYLAGGWQQIPLQIDERSYQDVSIPPRKKKHPAAEFLYVRDEGNGIDADDEIVFMASDAGERAPKTSWPNVGTVSERVELTINDPLQRGNLGYVYLVASSSHNSRTKDYVFYLLQDKKEHAAIVESDYYRARFSRRWVLDQIRPKQQLGGKGTDLIDRFKFRAYAQTFPNEDEEFWSDGPGDCKFSKRRGCSWYLGHKDGPVRAIRMVQGAASGPTTSYFAYFYPRMIEMQINYRVHPLPNLWFYMDYASEIGEAVYYDAANNGVRIDGRPDRLNGSKAGSWGQMSSAEGSLVTWINARNYIGLGRKTSIEPYYRDDAGFDDRTGDDGRSLGAHGVHIREIPNTDKVDAVISWGRIYLLPPNAPNQGAAFDRGAWQPLSATARKQMR